MHPTSKMLILGASSFVGRRMMLELSPTEAVGTFASTPIPNCVAFDPLKQRLADLVASHEPFSHVLILFAKSDPNYCFYNRAESRAINVEATIRVLEDAKQLGITPLFVSSEFAFDGRQGMYVEEDPPSPILEYGRHKIEIEEYIQQHFEQAIITRLSKTAGDDPADGTLFSSWLKRIKAGERVIECAADQYFSPIAVEDVGRAFVALVRSGATGIFNVTGPERFCRVTLLQMLISEAKRCGVKGIKIEPKSIHDFKLPEKRPLDVSMNPAKLVAVTGLRLTPMVEYCRRVVTRGLASRD